MAGSMVITHLLEYIFAVNIKEMDEQIINLGKLNNKLNNGNGSHFMYEGKLYNKNNNDLHYYQLHPSLINKFKNIHNMLYFSDEYILIKNYLTVIIGNHQLQLLPIVLNTYLKKVHIYTEPVTKIKNSFSSIETNYKKEQKLLKQLLMDRLLLQM